MAKEKQTFKCTSCGSISHKWAGQCQECKEWNSIEEVAEPLVVPAKSRYGGYSGLSAEVQSMADVQAENLPRFTSTIHELDRVLGGGLVPGSVVLIGGDPGVGKSTALLQVCCRLSTEAKVLYVSGEESLQQIAMRAKRLGLPDKDLRLLAETRVDVICDVATREQPRVMVIDSIQTMEVGEVGSAPGSVTQVRESAAYLTRFAKHTNTAVFLVGHVTKSGDLAGPRVLEHIIDVVCYFEGNADSRFRMLRAVKNRYGAVNELGVFAMTDKGLVEVKNPSAIFLSRQEKQMPGSVVMAVWEGSRPLLVEVQALVDESYGDNPRRVTVGMEQNRMVMLLAVLHKHCGVASYNMDVFLNVVGGVRIAETGADLAVLLAIVSSLKNQALPNQLLAFGEVGLAGEIRPVPSGVERIREAAKHGFQKAIVPKANVPKKGVSGIEIIGVATIQEALDVLGK